MHSKQPDQNTMSMSVAHNSVFCLCGFSAAICTSSLVRLHGTQLLFPAVFSHFHLQSFCSALLTTFCQETLGLRTQISFCLEVLVHLCLPHMDLTHPNIKVTHFFSLLAKSKEWWFLLSIAFPHKLLE